MNDIDQRKRGLQDDHDPSDLGQRSANKQQGIVKDQRGQEQPADKKRAQQSAKEGPAAYAPHQDEPTGRGGRQ